ncbi:Coiled-coil domain-containing protein 39 [Pseudolycoriella hygida]|uniref:Coiled-coil domain-containing protein 39 n=1 Tax=Pseudolycoriella hygida TaxID=35572 RepID=A0A9Q0MS31_9DIPT|nr:Coiled-coil domain-containing protein 39 [Pseudolycoriella hygida]
MADQRQIAQLMESMNWTDGSFVPIANDENKLLMEQMEILSKEKTRKIQSEQQFNDRLQRLTKNVTNTRHSIQENSKLLEAHRSQLKDEQHMFKISEHECSTYSKGIKDVQKQHQDLEKNNGRAHDEIEKLCETMEKSSAKIHWMKEALNEWTSAMARGDETNKLIEKYCKEDRKRAEELEYKRKTIQQTISKQRAVLVNSYEEQKSLENVLDRLSKQYRQVHNERQNTIRTWKKAVRSLNGRINEIESLNQDIEKSKITEEKKNNELREHVEFLNHQIENNKTVEYRIAEMNDKILKIRRKLTDLEEAAALQTNEMVTFRKLSQNLAGRLTQQRFQNRQSLRDHDEKQNLFEKGTVAFEALQKQMNSFIDRKFSAHDRLKHIEDLIEGEDKALKTVMVEQSRLGKALYRGQQIAQNYLNECKNIEADSHRLETAVSNYGKTFKDQNKELMNQNEIAYNVDCKISDVQSRIARMKGASTTRADPEVEKKLIELEELYAKKESQLGTMKSESEKLENDMRRLTVVYSDATNELQKLEDKIQAKQMECNGGEKALKSLILNHHERLVDHSVVKMRVRQMEDMVQKQMDKVCDLAKHKAELDMAMNERIVELQMQMDLLLKKRKEIMLELSQLKADVSERKIKIGAIIARYEHAVELLGRNEDGTLVSAVQVKVKNAQEKQLLMQEGNMLNEKVVKAERDIKMIENTLVLVNHSNERYKKTTENVVENSKEEADLRSLNAQLNEALMQLKNLKANYVYTANELDRLQFQRELIEKDLDDVSRYRMENNDQLMKIHKEILDQKSKMERAKREMKSSRKDVTQNLNDQDFLIMFDKDLDVKEKEHRNNVALQQLAEMVDSVIGMGPIISQHLCEKGLSMPHAAGSSRVTSHRSESEYSLKHGSSTKVSQRSLFSSCSSSNSTKNNESAKSLGPAIITLDFPDSDKKKYPISSHITNKNRRK